jgi:hypothetical protein
MMQDIMTGQTPAMLLSEEVLKTADDHSVAPHISDILEGVAAAITVVVAVKVQQAAEDCHQQANVEADC